MPVLRFGSGRGLHECQGYCLPSGYSILHSRKAVNSYRANELGDVPVRVWRGDHLRMMAGLWQTQGT